MIKMIPFKNLDKTDSKKISFDRPENEALSQDFTAVLSGFSAIQRSPEKVSETANFDVKNESFKNESDLYHQINPKEIEIKPDAPIDINPNQPANEVKYDLPIDINPNQPGNTDKYNTPIDINPNLPGTGETPTKNNFEGRIFTQFDDKVLYDKNSSGRNRSVSREAGDIRFANSVLEKTRNSGTRFVIDQENILDIPKNDPNQINKEQNSILDLDSLAGETVEVVSSEKTSVEQFQENDLKEIAEIKTDNFETHDLAEVETFDAVKVKDLKYFYNFETNRVDEVKKEKLNEKIKVSNLDILSTPTEEKVRLSEQFGLSQNKQMTAEPVSINSAEKPIPKPETPLSVSNEFSGVDFEKFLKSVSNKQEVVEVAPDFLIEDSAIYEQIEPKIIELSTFVEKTEEKQLMKMRLNPAELGEVEIRLEKDASGKINAHIRTENETARNILSESLGQLRDALQNSGLNIEKLEVSCNPNQTNGNEGRENGSRQTETGREMNFGNVEKEDEKRAESAVDRLVNLRA